MNNLIIMLVFVFATLVLFACLPPKRAYLAVKCFKLIASVFPISKICDALIAYYNNKKNVRF